MDYAALRGSLPSSTRGRRAALPVSGPPMRPHRQDTHELRCTGPHPDAPNRPCNGFLAEVVPGSVDVLQSAAPEPGCTVLTCKRCHAKWRVCPVGERAA